MNDTGYKILGYLVWQGGKWYVRRNYGRYLPSATTAAVAVGAIVAGAATLVFLASRRGS